MAGLPPAQERRNVHLRRTSAVPLEHGLRGEEDRALPPRRAGATGVPLQRCDQDREGELLPARRAHEAALAALQGAQLVPQEEDLDLQLPRVASPMRGQVKKSCEQGRQHAVDHERWRSFPERW